MRVGSTNQFLHHKDIESQRYFVNASTAIHRNVPGIIQYASLYLL